jgi:hypothetical protein
MSAALELLVPSVEDLETHFAENLARMDECAVGIIQSSELSGEISALDHVLQVAQRVSDMREALDSMETTLDLLKRFPEYRT